MTKAFLTDAIRILNTIGMILVAFVAAAAVVYTALSAFGVVPWMSFSMTFGETVIADAGIYLQSGLTALLVLMASFIPSAARVATLETGHRKFHMKMEDVARAYYHCHAADRGGVFNLQSEFDAVRERLSYLRDHPELGNLEADVLEVAAQMSQQSKHLALIYSDANVGRAKTFLRQRQEEVSRQKARIDDARQIMREIDEWSSEIDMEESMVASQLSQLEERLLATMPHLAGHQMADHENVYPMKPWLAGE